MKNKVFKSGIWYTISNFLVRGVGFFTTPIFTRILTKEQYGGFSNISTLISVTLIVTSLNLEASLTRAKYDFEDDIDNYVYSMMVLSIISTIVWYIISICFRVPLTEVLNVESKYIKSMFIYLLFCPIINAFQNIECLRYKYKTMTVINLGLALSSSIISIILVFSLSDKLMGRMIGYVIPMGVIGTFIFAFYTRKKRKVKTKYWKYAIPFTLPFIPHLLSMNLLSSMDRLMIGRICGQSDLALYSLAYTCGTIISILVTSINTAFSPWLAEQLAKKNYEQIRKISVPYVLFFAYFAVGIVLVTPEVLFILGGKGYIEAVTVMPPVAASTILQFIYCMYVNIEQFEKHTKLMACASVVACILNFLLNQLFIPKFGYVAAAYTTYASYFILMILHVIIVKHIKMDGVYNGKAIIILAVAVSLFMFFSSVFIKYIVVRYFVVAIYIMCGVLWAIKNKEKIFIIINKNTG